MSNHKGQTLTVAAFLFFLSILLLFIIISQPQQFIFIFIIALVVLLLSFVNTNFALILLILSMLLSPEIEAGGGVTGRSVVIRIDDLFLFIVFFGWMAKMALNKELGLIRSTPLNRPILLYLGICILATSISIVRGLLGVKESFFYLLKYFEYFLLFFMVANNIKTLKESKTFVFFILLTCVLTSLFAWTRIPTGERLSAPFEGRGGEPNTFAGYLLLMMAIILGLLIHSQTRRQKLVYVSFLSFIFVPFVMTLSRGGWISFFPMFLVIIAFGKKYRLALLSALIIFVIIAPFAFPSKVYHRINETFTPERSVKMLGREMYMSESAAARIQSWDAAIERLRVQPLLGYGVPAGSVIDNQYSRVLSEVGIIGFLVFLWMIARVFKVAWNTYTKTMDEPFAQGLSIGLIAGLCGLLVLSFTTACFILIRIMEPFWFIVAIVVMLPEIINNNEGGLAHA